MRVMVVDNDRAWTRSLGILLSERGFDVRTFTEPEKAGEFVREAARTTSTTRTTMPDAVVLDYVMPRMGGLELLGLIRRDLKPDCKVVLVTGHKEQLDGERLCGMGVCACLAKPVDLDELVQILTNGEQR